jgi:DnaJ-class molecular chaperone
MTDSDQNFETRECPECDGYGDFEERDGEDELRVIRCTACNGRGVCTFYCGD